MQVRIGLYIRMSLQNNQWPVLSIRVVAYIGDRYKGQNYLSSRKGNGIRDPV